MILPNRLLFQALGRRFSTAPASGPNRTLVELFFDTISPYSYIQFELLTRQRRYWDRMQLKFTPIFLLDVFKDTDNSPPVLVPAKGRYLGQDMKRMAKFYEIPYKINPDFMEFGMKRGSLKVQHFLVALQSRISEVEYERLIGALFGTFFSPTNPKDISLDGVIRDLAAQAGIKSEIIEEALLVTDSVKRQLAENNNRLVELGGFGAPSTVIHLPKRSELIWGSDRMNIIGEMLGYENKALKFL